MLTHLPFWQRVIKRTINKLRISKQLPTMGASSFLLSSYPLAIPSFGPALTATSFYLYDNWSKYFQRKINST